MWGWLCAAPWENSGRREVTISWIICSPRGLGWSCAAPRIWRRSRCCSCCWELPPLWQVWMHPASLSSPAGNPGCSSLTCTAYGHSMERKWKEGNKILQSRACHLFSLVFLCSPNLWLSPFCWVYYRAVGGRAPQPRYLWLSEWMSPPGDKEMGEETWIKKHEAAYHSWNVSFH